MRASTAITIWIWLYVAAVGRAQPSTEHARHAGAAHAEAVKAPKVFLDKSPKIVEYQLKRLSNAELLMVERGVDDPKYVPVHAAILARAAIPSGQRRAAAEALAQLKSTSIIAEILVALEALVAEDAQTARSARDLIGLLLNEPKSELQRLERPLVDALNSESLWARRAATAGLLLADQTHIVRQHRSSSAGGAVDFLTAVSWLTDQPSRDAWRKDVIAYLDPVEPPAVRLQAVRTLATIATDSTDSFVRLVGLSQEATSPKDILLKDEVIRSLLKLPPEAREPRATAVLAGRLVESAETTPIAARTSESFIDAVQLAESLLPVLPSETSRLYRQRLQAVSVRVVRIRTIEEEMRYDVKYFAVESGRPVEIMLKNDDIMPHNLVITMPGALKEVAMDAAKMAPDQVTAGKQYVPASDKVLHATSMVAAGKLERLAFAAPTTPGEYPFVCTFPNHWMRMYGVMVVVTDLDTWQLQPTPPADPIGNNRSFVRKWSLNDLAGEMDDGLRGRSAEIGARLLKEATCVQCHKHRGEGGLVGPDLTDVVSRWKGDRRAILQEILDPSHKIEPKYALQSVLTGDGKVYSGIIVAETKESLSLVSSPEQSEPTRLARDEIDEIVQSSKSIMPAGLLDQYTQDEIFEILAYLIASHP